MGGKAGRVLLLGVTLLAGTPGSAGSLGTSTVLSGVTSNANRFILGDAVSPMFNSLRIEMGGALLDRSGSIVGAATNANNNSAVVTDPGSVWQNDGPFLLGADGSFNVLLVTNGGLLFLAAPAVLGDQPAAARNLAIVTGNGSTWFSSAPLDVGRAGSFNRLEVHDGAQAVLLGECVLGREPSAGRNLLSVSGPGATLRLNQPLRVGLEGSFNRLTVADGGHLAGGSQPLRLGDSPGSDFNRVRVSGREARLECAALAIGAGGSYNQVTIADAGRLRCAGAWIGFDPGSSNNLLAVAGNGACCEVDGTLAFGPAPGNTLALGDGGEVRAARYEQGASGVLEIGLGGTATNRYGRLTVIGHASLDGALHVALTNGFSPGRFDTLAVMQFGSCTGTFTNLPVLDAGLGRSLWGELTATGLTLRLNYRLSGAELMRAYPPSVSLEDLAPRFRTNVLNLLRALEAATDEHGRPNVTVEILETTVSPARAYLIHYATAVARKKIEPADVPQPFTLLPAVTNLGDVFWLHLDETGQPDRRASEAAARAMLIEACGKVIKKVPPYPDPGQSGQQIKMRIEWTGELHISDARGQRVVIHGKGGSGEKSRQFRRVAAGYRVFKLPKQRWVWAEELE